MKIIISSELESYAKEKNLILSIRKKKLRKCCIGKVLTPSTNYQLIAQIIEGAPHKDSLDNYQQQIKKGIIIYLDQVLIDNYKQLSLGFEKFLFVKRFTVEKLE